jgi:hypothetical protein
MHVEERHQSLYLDQTFKDGSVDLTEELSSVSPEVKVTKVHRSYSVLP